MRDLVIASLGLLALVGMTLAPSLDELSRRPADSRVLAGSPLPTPTRSPGPWMLPTWRTMASGAPYVVCGASDAWRRPTLAEQTARLASDPRYRRIRFDDDSQAAQAFRAPAVLYDGAGESSAQGLVAYTGLWSDPALHRNHCTSAEPQVWLFGYEPVDYAADDRDIAMLRVRPAAGYRFVVLTGTLRRTLVVAAGTKLATFDMSPWLTPASNLSANQTLPSSMPLPRSEGTPLPTVPPPAPVAFVLPKGCAITEGGQGVRTGQSGEVVHWIAACPGAPASEFPKWFLTRVEEQGWTKNELTGSRATYRKGDLELTLEFSGSPGNYLWFAESPVRRPTPLSDSPKQTAPAVPPGKAESEAIRQAALAKMKAGPTAQSPKPTFVRQHVDVSSYPQGLRDVGPGQVPISAQDFHPTSVYQRVVGGTIWWVYAGARASDLSQGVLIVHTADPNDPSSLVGKGEAHTYDAPRKTGAIHLDAVAGDVLSFTTPDGTHGTFNLASGTFSY